MTRKHFVALANALACSRPVQGEDFEEATAQWRCDIQAVADVCREQNPNFDRERFLNACYK